MLKSQQECAGDVFLHHLHILFSVNYNMQNTRITGLEHFGTDDAIKHMRGVISKSMFLISQAGAAIPAQNKKNGEAKRWA